MLALIYEPLVRCINIRDSVCVEKVTADGLGGQSLKYRRIDSGGYLLYSIGWDEKDDGGVAGKSNQEGDWAWELP